MILWRDVELIGETVLHTLDHDVDASEFASDAVTHEVICIVDVNVLHELHFVCGDEVDDLDVT